EADLRPIPPIPTQVVTNGEFVHLPLLLRLRQWDELPVRNDLRRNRRNGAKVSLVVLSDDHGEDPPSAETEKTGRTSTSRVKDSPLRCVVKREGGPCASLLLR